jgi:hypothetical protein
MKAADLLHQARAASVGLSATAEGNLRWRSTRPLPSDLLKELAFHKAELLTLLREEEDEAAICRAIEQSEGLAPGSVRLWEPPRVWGES